jgi:hypothetical protein
MLKIGKKLNFVKIVEGRFKMKKGLKYDLTKPRWEVLTFGAKKYQTNSWQKVEPKERYFAACLRHLTAWQKGEQLDQESHLPHLAHALCCLMFLLWKDENQK